MTGAAGFLRAAAVLGVFGISLTSSLIPAEAVEPAERSLVILGIDGMDPNLLERYLAEGKMPHFKAMIDGGGDFERLATSFPPQSPVAWSNFAVGANPGYHGIFDFIHRHAETLTPYLSITETKGPEKVFTIGPWQIPLSGASVTNLRRGRPYWQDLCEAGIPTTIGQVPANYPPMCPCHSERARILSGMGTPDLLGTQGTFSFYSSEKMDLKKVIGGGSLYAVEVREGKVEARLYGPPHPYKNPKAYENNKEALALSIPFTVWVDEENRMAKLSIQNQELILKQGEFSDWVRVEFEVIPLVQKISAIARFYLKEASPAFKLYVSPVNIDPSNPAVPISLPPSYAKELYDAVGFFYTQNMPPDTKALEHEVFSDDEFVKQVKVVFQEEEKRLKFELGRFREGFLFHYFSVLDQTSHTFWRTIDPKHPLYTPELARKYGRVIEDLYLEFDRILGEIRAGVGPDTVILVVSDHGFTSFRRGINLNTIFLHRGFMAQIDPAKQATSEFFSNTDWGRTRAYNVGINSVYINLQGREPLGSVPPGQYDAVAEELRKMLLELVDPKTGEHPIKRVLRREEIYRGPYLADAPDLVIGFADGYRASWDTILGETPEEAIVDNLSAWSGDHTIDWELVPGVIVSNRKLESRNPALVDIAPTVLEYFGIPSRQVFDGKPLFSAHKGAA